MAMPARSLLQRLGARCGAAARRRHGRSLAISSAARCSAHAAPAAQVRTQRRTKAANATWWCVCWAGARGSGVLAGAALNSSKAECRELCLVLRVFIEGVEGSTNTPSRGVFTRVISFLKCCWSENKTQNMQSGCGAKTRARKMQSGEGAGTRAANALNRTAESPCDAPLTGG